MKKEIQETKPDRAAAITAQMKEFPQRRHTLKCLTAACGDNSRENRAATRQTVDELVAAGVIEECGKERYRLSRKHLPVFEGVVDMMQSGSMFVKVEGRDEDIFVDARDSMHALNGDTVKVSLLARKRTGRAEGEIVDIVRRADKRYVGTVDVMPHCAFVTVDSRKMPVDVYVRLDGSLPDLKTGQKVVVSIVDWDLNSKNPVGRILDVLGIAGDNNTEMHAILAEYDLPYCFEKQVEQDAEHIAGTISERDYAERRDFRDVVTFTIDPDDAKDFDDAISIKKLGEGLWEVGVHIADVTHYVRPGSIVDGEAVERATSVYLVDRTIPMLPERLSNELCSLRPDEEKLCFSVVFTIDADLNIQNRWFGRTVIKSNRRFTYAEAQNIIETGKGDYATEVLTLNDIAQRLRKARFAAGAISFEREEAKFKLDENGKPLGVYFKEMKQSNQLVEEFMLLANKGVAEFVGKVGGKASKRTFVYRVHDLPDSDKLGRFSDFILKFGYYIKTDKIGAVSKELNKLMAKIHGKSEENVISTIAVRTMAKAYYSTDNIGHYGLSFPYYTHFTSPIRRYPDMMVHRLLANYLAGGASADKQAYEKLCIHSSEMEVRAAEAERASIKYKMVEFMLDKVGQQFNGHISGITDWGIFVELDDTHIEGMVSMRDMQDDYYVFDADNYVAVGQRTGRRFVLGDGVCITIKRADLGHRQLDFEMSGSIDFETGTVTPVENTLSATDKSRSYSSKRVSDRSKSGDRSKASGRSRSADKGKPSDHSRSGRRTKSSTEKGEAKSRRR